METIPTMIQANLIKFQLPNLTFMPFALFAFSMSIGVATGQAPNKNSPYSPSPNGKIIEQQSIADSSVSGPLQATFIMQIQKTQNGPAVDHSTFEIAKNGEAHLMPLREVYKVGVGDVLFVNIKNSTQGSRECTVQPDGTIDFPLAERI